MADSILFVGWGVAVRGREEKAQDVFQESVAYWKHLEDAGEIESHQVVLLMPHGGDLRGFAMLRGDAAGLDAVRRSDEFQRLFLRAGLVVEDLGLVTGVTGAAIGAQMATVQGALGELT